MSRQEKIEKLAYAMIHTVFKLKQGETLVITGDFGSNHDINEAIAKEAYEVGAKAVMFITAPAECHGKVADKVIPFGAFTKMMEHADCWLDTGTMGWLYSDAHETVLTTKKDIRYLLISVTDLDFLIQMFIENHSEELITLCDRLNEMVSKASLIRMANVDGTDVTFELDHDHVITIDIGNASRPGFFTIPALFNFVPKFGTAHGKLVFRGVYADPWGLLETPMTLVLEKGNIVDVLSEKQEDADSLKAWLAQWKDPAIYSVAHTNIGLLPKVHGLCGQGILDERGWGTLNWGFGNVSASEAPPIGQPCVSHFDGMVLDGSVWVDDVQVMENGKFVHPELKIYADKICSEN